MLADVYNELVQTELGLISTVDADGDVVFKHPELGTLYIKTFAEDPEFFMLVFPSFLDCNAMGLSPEQLLHAINAVNSKSKSVKLVVQQSKVEDGSYAVTATVECFLAAADEEPDRELLRSILRRNLAAIRNGASSLLAQCSALKKPSAEAASTRAVASLH